jgi:uncharacterized protein with HEPN domain
MTRSDLDRLRDARKFAQHALFHAIGLSAEGLAGALEPQHATFYALIVVGEALSEVPVDLRNEAPGIPWKAVIGLRNHLVHAYWQIDLEIIADVIKNRLDPLTDELDKLIALVERIEK